MKAIFIDAEHCIGCKNCEIQCAIAHSGKDSIFEAIYVNPKPKPRIFVEYIGVAVPIQCRHCENAPCMAACPSNAIKKEDGIVVVEKEKCIGCKACMMVCPFGAMSIDAECGVLKCDLCGGNPACVNACKTGALQYGDVLELVKERRRKYLKNLCLK